MSAPNSPQHVYLSYIQSDERYAHKFREILEALHISVSSCRESTDTEEVQSQVESALTHCSVVVILISDKTRESRWVDLEIALATEPRSGQPSAGLLGIILPDHADFAKPYYEPDNIPLRLHDRTQWEYAIIRKWSDDPRLIEQWLKDADRRRYHFSSTANVSTIRALRVFQWNDGIDTARPVLQRLSDQE